MRQRPVPASRPAGSTGGRVLSAAGAFAREVAEAWSEDRCFSRAAAVAFYTAFSVAPILVIVLWLVGLFVDTELAAERLVLEIRRLGGPAGADVLPGALTLIC